LKFSNNLTGSEMSSLKATKIVPAKVTKSVRGKSKKLSKELINSRIALVAYYKAEARGYEPGHEIQDWLEAEAEILKDQ
jgi:hypothetical protein